MNTMMSKTTVQEQTLFISGPTGKLEALWQSLNIPSPEVIAVICHPHPLYGGTMQNKVVTTVARACREVGIASVRFNFRGVGQSEGAHDNGVGETTDALAIIAWAQSQYPDAKIILVGFSFGAYVAQRTAQTFNPALLISIAPPVHHFEVAQLAIPSCPWVVMQGDADEIVPPQEVYDWIGRMPRQPKLIRFDHTSHFFHGKLLELQAALVEELVQIVKAK